MAWNDVMVTMLRMMIDDVDSTAYKYDDERLEKQLLLSAQLIQTGELEFTVAYTINIPSITLSPDPVTENDNAFINLVTLKAACLLDMAEARIAAEQGIDISDVGSRIALSGRATNKLALLKAGSGGFCDAYKQAKKEFVLGSMSPGMAIVSPFRLYAGFTDGLEAFTDEG
jgi:hypothetical protein